MSAYDGEGKNRTTKTSKSSKYLCFEVFAVIVV